MGHKLEGNGLWESSRMMLPEHKERIIVENFEFKHKRLPRPTLDEQGWEQIMRILMESLGTQVSAHFKLYDEYEDSAAIGIVERVDPYRESFVRQMIKLISFSEFSIVDLLDGLYRQIFSINNIFSEELASQLVNEGFQKILNRGDKKELVFITQMLQIQPEIKKMCPVSLWKTFIDRVESLQRDQDNVEIRGFIGAIFRNINTFE